jgi:hypothetical protein
MHPELYPELYQQTQETLCALAACVRPLPLAEFLQAIDRAERWGPIVDPTLNRAAMVTLATITDLAEAARVFQRAVDRIAPAAMDSGAGRDG